MKPTPPVTTQRISFRRVDADALVAETRAPSFRRTPDVAPVHDDVTAHQFFYLGEIRCAIASPLGQKDERVGAAERVVLCLHDLQPSVGDRASERGAGLG